MDLERIREFAVFAQSLKFVDAARELHMSQSSLSRHIQAMEQELRFTLTFDIVEDFPFEGGAFPIGPDQLVLGTKYYARYYESLDVEDVKTLAVREFTPVVRSYLVYRRDTTSTAALQIIAAARRSA